MTNGEEYTYGFVPNANDAFADADGDRYPNVFEVRKGSDPNSQSSIPTPNYVVNGAGGGTHTTISAALTAANVANGAYQIIAIAPGVYLGTANTVNVSIASTKPELLFIGLQGAGQTIIDGEQTNVGWNIQNSAVVASLTFRNTPRALTVQSRI
jgi:pectin methylesterase-like acyl-CoA thioesterase